MAALQEALKLTPSPLLRAWPRADGDWFVDAPDWADVGVLVRGDELVCRGSNDWRCDGYRAGGVGSCPHEVAVAHRLVMVRRYDRERASWAIRRSS